jgi:replicative DNA helicase
VNATVPPHDLLAEGAVLSAAILSPEALAEASDVVTAEMFYSDANRRIFAAVLDVDREHGRVDTVLVARRLRDAGHLETVGGAPYLARLTDETVLQVLLAHGGSIRVRPQEVFVAVEDALRQKVGLQEEVHFVLVPGQAQ